MIDRYKRKEISNIWTDQKKFEAYLKVEIESVKAWSIIGVIPKKDIALIEKNAKFELNDIYELEKEYKHDVIAFTRAVSKSLGDEKKWVHYGLTSTDVVDTAYGYLLKQANDIILNDLMILMDVLREKAIKYKHTPIIGRTHGIHADITSFGLKFCLYHDEMKRNIDRFMLARKDVECGKISGAVGNYANIDPFIEQEVCSNLGINRANISTQVLQRDRHAFYLTTLTLISNTLEKIALEIRHLQRTEVGEASEFFSSNQKGSSAMPHKKNPISCENICGLSRVMRGYMLSGFENTSLWHERDISHSSVERIILPDSTILIDYMLSRMTNVLSNLCVNDKKMLDNIYLTHGTVFSQRVLNLLIEKGISREQAYDLVQQLSMECLNDKLDFKSLVLSNSSIMSRCTQKEIEGCFDLKYYFKNIEHIYESVCIYNGGSDD